MKILHVLTSNKLSGAENVVADISMMFSDSHDMAYCSPDGPIRKALSDRGVNYISVPKLNINELRKVIKNYKPDLIHAHDIKATVFSVLASGKIPVISHLHGNTESMRKVSFKSLIYLLSTIKVKTIISVSDSVLNDYIFKSAISKKTICLKNILYPRRITKLINFDKEIYGYDFGYVGRLSYPKNPRRVAEVASLVLRKLPNSKFLVIGEGDLKEEMEEVFNEKGVISRVHFTGNLESPYGAIKQLKCMVMTSRFEGTPIVALEAMVLGTPIVSTPVDGMLDLIEQNKTGLLSDDDNELALTIERIITDDQFRNEMRISSQKRIQKINKVDIYKEKLNALYEQSLIKSS